MTRAMRKTLIIFGGVLALLLLLLILVPVLFGGRIAERVKTQANRSLNAKVDWRDAGLSLFGDFPNLTLGLDGSDDSASAFEAASALAERVDAHLFAVVARRDARVDFAAHWGARRRSLCGRSSWSTLGSRW